MPSKIALYLLTAVCAVPFSGIALAAPVDEKQQLLEFLEEQTRLATKTRLNADYVPGIITVLHGDDLEQRGARTVWEALGLVPGVKPVLDQQGHRRIVVRGIGAIGNNWNTGNIKVLVNGVSMNTAERGLAESVYYIPVEQVERIEVIRGPGSAIHGEYAIAGVVNVITRRETSRVFAFGGEFDTVGGGAIVNLARGDLRFSLNLGGWRSDGADVTAGTDMMHEVGLSGASHAPGPANEEIQASHGSATLGYGNLSLLAQWTEHRIGDYFGINYTLPPTEDELVETNRTRVLEVRYRHSLPHGEVALLAGTRNYVLRKDDLYAMPSEQYGISGGPDVYIDLEYEERKRYLGAELTHSAGRHTLLLGAYQSRTDVHQAVQSSNLSYDPVTWAPIISATKSRSAYPVAEGTERTTESFVLQDEFRASDRFTLTTGVRYDHYSGVGTSLTPRIAGVWRLGESRTFKAQYGRAFRPPTFIELAYGEPGIQPVTIDTLEASYTTKGPRGHWRTTLFYSELNDLIVFDPANAPAFFFRNATSAQLHGVEIEGLRRVTERLDVDGSVSYVRSRQADIGGTIPGTSDWLARAGLQYRLAGGMLASLEYQYVGAVERQPEDPRDELDDFSTVDLTFTGHEGQLTWRAGIKNLFDADVRYPAFLTTNIANEPVVSYRDDLPRAGTHWWIHLSYGF